MQIESPEMEFICNGIIHFEKGHRIINEIIKLLVEEYDPEEYKGMVHFKCGTCPNL